MTPPPNHPNRTRLGNLVPATLATATGGTLAALAATLSTGAAPETPPTEVAFESLRLTDTFFCEGATAADVDRDGKADVISGPYWYAGPDFAERHEIYPAAPFEPKGYSDNFLTFHGDVDRDGWVDVVVFGWPGKEVFWFRNPGDSVRERRWDRFLAVPVADNESPHYADITGDGVAEAICSQDGRFILASPGEDPTQPWKVTPISEKATGGKYTHGLGLGDVNGDGRLDLLDKDNWWEQPASLEGDPLWKRHRYQFAGRGGAQMFADDFDGDGDNDILTSINAHGWGLAWFEQTEREDGTRTFIPHQIVGEKPEENRYGVAFSQMHAIDMVDVDGDGVRDIVTGKRWWAHSGNDPGADMPAVLYWFRTVRGNRSGVADFIPYPIHGDSGVGTQVTATDFTGDGRPDIVVGNKKGTFIHLQRTKG